jgi:uncharacterized protein DUF2380
MGNSSVATTRGVIEMAYWKAANLFVAVAVLVIGAGGAAAAESRRVAFFGFFLINTSLQPTQPAEEKRLEMLDTFYGINLLVLAGSASLPFPPEVQRQAVAGSGIPNCNGCERDLAEKTGAEWVTWGTVQKVSNLILNINLYMEDVQTGRIEFAHSVDIRGNTDETWLHGLNYMIRNYVLEQP